MRGRGPARGNFRPSSVLGPGSDPHPGPLPYLAHADLLGDGRNQLLAAGYDSKLASAVLWVLDPSDVREQQATTLHIAGIRENLAFLSFLAFPPTAATATVALPVSRASHLDVTRDRIYFSVAESVRETDPKQIVYHLDYKMNVVDVSMTYAYQVFYDNLFATHRLKVPLDPDGVRQIKENVWGVRQKSFKPK